MHIINNPNCSVELKEELFCKLTELYDDQALAFVLSHKDCSVYLFYYIIENNIKKNKDFISILNAKKLDDKCPKKYLQYVANNNFLKGYLSKKSIDKIQKYLINNGANIFLIALLKPLNIVRIY